MQHDVEKGRIQTGDWKEWPVKEKDNQERVVSPRQLKTRFQGRGGDCFCQIVW